MQDANPFAEFLNPFRHCPTTLEQIHGVVLSTWWTLVIYIVCSTVVGWVAS